MLVLRRRRNAWRKKAYSISEELIVQHGPGSEVSHIREILHIADISSLNVETTEWQNRGKMPVLPAEKKKLNRKTSPTLVAV